MKKQSAALAAAFLFQSLLPLPCAAAPDEDAAMRAARLNRSMLRRFEEEYRTLKDSDPSTQPFIRTEMRKLSYKIKALSDDARRIEGMLSEEERAEMFLEEVVWQAERRGAEVARRHAGPVPGDRVWQLHEKALEHVARRRLPDAAKLYREIILEDPDDDQAYLILGHVELLMGRYPEAETAFDNAIHIDPANRDEIAPFYENQIMADPNNAQAHANLGIAYLMLGRFDRARRSIADALSLDPGNAAALDGLALIESL